MGGQRLYMARLLRLLELGKGVEARLIRLRNLTLPVHCH